MGDIRVDIVLAGEGRTRKIRPDATCRFCPVPILPEHAVVRIEDYGAGPGVRQWCAHKMCWQLLLDITIDDDLPIARIYGDFLSDHNHEHICN